MYRFLRSHPLFVIIFTLLTPFSNYAQEQQASLGIFVSYDLLNNTSNNADKFITSGQTIGIEYSEIKGMFGYRLGLAASIIKDQDLLNYLNSYITPSQLPIYPSIATLSVIDLQTSLQYVYYEGEKVDLYGNGGMLLTVGRYHNEDYTKYFLVPERDPTQSLSIRGLLGGGLIYKINSKLQVDISFHRKLRFHTFENHYIQPYSSYNFQVKIARVF